MKNPKRTRVATGIYSDQCGYLATVSYRGLRRDQRFPPDTPIDFMASWQTRTRADLDQEAVTAKPTARRRVRVAQGIYRDRYGVAATVKVGGVQREQRFAHDTPRAAINEWQAATRVRLNEDRHDAAVARLMPRTDHSRLQRSADGWCYVYVMRSGDRVKIGRATDPAQRLRDLQVAHSKELSLVLAMPAHAALEAAIHKRFAHLHVRGEWFRIEPDLVAFIDAVRSGANPITLLWS